MGFRTANMRELVATLLKSAFEAAQQAGALPPAEVPDPIPVEPSRHAAHGDYGSPVCLGLARVLRRSPMAIAQTVVEYVPAVDFVARVEAAPPGFINVTLAPEWLAAQVPAILAAGDTWGNVPIGRGERVQVEFVSANPTGPITIGSARNAVLGDVLASVLEAAGYEVAREYYVNDAGSKVRNFGESIFARYAGLYGMEVPFPEAGYPGAYVTDLARQAKEVFGDLYLGMDAAQAARELGSWGIDQVLGWIKRDLALLRVEFDFWRRERYFYESGLFDQMMQKLRDGGYLVEYDGAVWFRHEELEKDAVLIRSPQVVVNPDERPTYLASDIAYLWDKLVLRGFDKAVYIWGADHHGDVPRVRAAAKALGLDPSRLIFILYQMVTLTRGGEKVRMSKSSGEFVTLRELIDEVGADPIRFMMLTRTVDVTLEFDLDLAVEQSDRNPVYYVQYAHTRIAGVLRRAAAMGWDIEEVVGDPALLRHPSELALIRKMLALPEVIALAAKTMAPHHLAAYATELASLFHAFYRDCRIVSTCADDAALTRARLMLARAAKTVLGRVLGLMGVAAPERM